MEDSTVDPKAGAPPRRPGVSSKVEKPTWQSTPSNPQKGSHKVMQPQANEFLQRDWPWKPVLPHWKLHVRTQPADHLCNDLKTPSKPMLKYNPHGEESRGYKLDSHMTTIIS